MKLTTTTSLVALLALALVGSAQPSHTVTKADYEKWMKDLSNWGRWGKDDQMGTVNLITPAKVKEAVALVHEGLRISLAHDILTEKAADNNDPFTRTTFATGANPVAGSFAMDRYSVSYHGFAHTHMDALSHAFHDGKMYNGYPQSGVTAAGAPKNDITHFKNGIVTRGILIDIPRLKGLPYLEPAQAIYPEDLDAWEKKTGVKVGAGDVVFIRTGRWARRAAKGPWSLLDGAAGLYASSAVWLRKRDIAMLGSDDASDVAPSGVDGVLQPIHFLMLISFGTPIFDNCDLEELSKTAERLHRWDFMLVAAPLPVPGGTGSPLNPIALF
jgi:kynurenine formamidase